MRQSAMPSVDGEVGAMFARVRRLAVAVCLCVAVAAVLLAPVAVWLLPESTDAGVVGFWLPAYTVVGVVAGLLALPLSRRLRRVEFNTEHRAGAGSFRLLSKAASSDDPHDRALVSLYFSATTSFGLATSPSLLGFVVRALGGPWWLYALLWVETLLLWIALYPRASGWRRFLTVVS